MRIIYPLYPWGHMFKYLLHLEISVPLQKWLLSSDYPYDSYLFMTFLKPSIVLSGPGLQYTV